MRNNKTPVKYLRLLSYDNACKVIDFVNKNDRHDYAHVTHGGVSMQVSEKNWQEIEKFIISLNTRYEIGVVPPHKVAENIINNLKQRGMIGH